MRRVLTCTAATLVAAMGPAASAVARTGAAKSKGAPPQDQIDKALQSAESSKLLWATVNVCVHSPHHGGLIGVRGEMPALGFATTLTMTIQLNQRSSKTGSFAPVPGSTAARTVIVGTFAGQVHQAGAEFPYASDAGRLNATVTFAWSRGTTQLGQVTQTTTGGHPQADYGQPPHHSSATCKF